MVAFQITEPCRKYARRTESSQFRLGMMTQKSGKKKTTSLPHLDMERGGFRRKAGLFSAGWKMRRSAGTPLQELFNAWD
jgi:hypothetical protein